MQNKIPCPLIKTGSVKNTLGQLVSDQAVEFKDKVFLQFEGQEFSYQFLDDHTNRLANGFRQYTNIGKGDHVGLVLSNCPQFLWIVVALAKLGAVIVPINTAAKGDMLDYFLEHSDVSLVIVETDLLERVRTAARKIPAIERIVSVSQNGKTPSRKNVIAYDDLLDADPQPITTQVSPSDPLFIMYTSGTTGPSKGVVSPHSQSLSVGHQVAGIYRYFSDDILYTCLPLFHVNALWYSVFAALTCGATVTLSRRFSASRFWSEIMESQATQTNMLGVMANIALKELGRLDTKKLKLRQCMVVPALSKGDAIIFENALGIKVTSLYAQTETFAVTLFSPDAPRQKVGSAGRVFEYADILIANEEDNGLSAGDVGEILIRPSAPQIIMSGYYKMPAETEETMRGNWFHSGDRGFVDEDGYLFFVDRKKDAIRRRGENISAYELEMIVSKHPSVREAAAVAVTSSLSEDEVLVFVVPTAKGVIDFPELIEFCDQRMSYFMVPRFLHELEELPKTSSEKIEKYKLQEWAMKHLNDLWDREKEGIEIKR